MVGIKSPLSRFRTKSSNWTRHQGERGGTYWQNPSGAKVYQENDPGGDGATATPDDRDAKLKGYAEQIRAKFGDKAGEQLDAMREKVKDDPAKVAALDKVASAMGGAKANPKVAAQIAALEKLTPANDPDGYHMQEQKLVMYKMTPAQLGKIAEHFGVSGKDKNATIQAIAAAARNGGSKKPTADKPTAPPAKPEAKPEPSGDAAAKTKRVADLITSNTPLNDAFKSSGMSLGEFHDTINALADSGAIELHENTDSSYKWNNDASFTIRYENGSPKVMDRATKGDGNIKPPAHSKPAPPSMGGDLKAAASRWFRENKTDAPLDVLYEQVAKPVGVTIGQFQDVIRDLASKKEVRLFPYTRPPSSMPEAMAKVAFTAGQEMKGYLKPIDSQSIPSPLTKSFTGTKVDLGDPQARIEAIADILAGLYGDKALAMLDGGEAKTLRSPFTKSLRWTIEKKWSEVDHPRGKGGRFIPKGSQEAATTAKESIKAALKTKTPETAKKLVEHLNILTVKQLHELKKEYKLSASGETREKLIAKLAERLGKGREDVPKGEDKPYKEWAKGEREGRKPKEAHSPEPTQIPHEMTIEEYKRRRGDNAAALAFHKKEVKEAIAAGKNVPPEVLADYPDLAKNKPAGIPSPLKKPKSAVKNRSLLAEVILEGGLNLEAVRQKYNVKEEFLEHGLGRAFERSITPGFAKKGKGVGLDQMTEQLEAQGLFQTPKGRNADDYLLELLQNKVKSDYHDYDAQVEREQAAYYKELEDAKRYADQSEIEAAVRAGEEAGQSEGDSWEVGEDAGGMADEEGSGGEVGEFEFGAGETATEKIVADKSGLESHTKEMVKGEHEKPVMAAVMRQADMDPDEWDAHVAKVRAAAKNAKTTTPDVIEEAAAAVIQSYNRKTEQERSSSEQQARSAALTQKVREQRATPEYQSAYQKLKDYLKNGGEFQFTNHVRGKIETLNQHSYIFDDATGTIRQRQGRKETIAVDPDKAIKMASGLAPKPYPAIPSPLKPLVQPGAAQDTSTERKYADKKGIELRRAPAGGAVSDVDGVHYAGGRLMPIHGLSPKSEKKPKGEGVGTSDEKVNEDAKGRQRTERGPMSAEDIEAERGRREDKRKWDEMRYGPLGGIKWLGDNPNHKATSNNWTEAKKWQSFAESIGPQGVKQLVEKLEPIAHARMDAEYADAKAKRDASGGPFDDDGGQWHKDDLKRRGEDTHRGTRNFGGHEKRHPGSWYARELVHEILGNVPKGESVVDNMHELNRILAEAKSTTTKSLRRIPSPLRKA